MNIQKTVLNHCELMQNPGKGKVLVIDDERPVRSMIVRTLELDGYELMDADGAEAGLDMARRHRPDVILCDVIMDKVDGYAALSSLRECPGTAAIPFILMTGLADNAGMRRGMKLGADDYLAKPFSGSELREAVGAQVRKTSVQRRESEQQMAELRAKIELALPHELLTPLNGILGFSELLESSLEVLPPEEVREMARTISQSAGRLRRLIQNHLIFAQIEFLAMDPAKLRSLQASVSEGAGGLVECAAMDMARLHGRLKDLTCEPGGGRVAMSQEYFSKIIQELVENACKFSAPGQPVRVGSEVSGGFYRVRILDQGRGMSADHVRHIGAFMQFDRRFYEQQGLGLGLAIARRLAEIHGGRLEIRSEPGAGTEVELFLPCAQGAA